MSIRTERIASVIKDDLGGILLKYQSNNIITITSVKVTPDLSMAKVFISILDSSGYEKAAFQKLVEKTAEIRMELASKMRHQVRKIPEIIFYDDDTAEYAEKMEKLFRKVKDEKPPASDTNESGD